MDFKDLCERLKKLDEVTLMEVLDLSSEDLVDRFEDVIEERFDLLVAGMEDEETSD